RRDLSGAAPLLELRLRLPQLLLQAGHPGLRYAGTRTRERRLLVEREPIREQPRARLPCEPAVLHRSQRIDAALRRDERRVHGGHLLLRLVEALLHAVELEGLAARERLREGENLAD